MPAHGPRCRRRCHRGSAAAVLACAVLACAAMTAAGCSAGPAATVPGERTAAARYLAIAVAGNHRLDTDFDRLNGRDRSDLAAARADLRDVAATERLFDQRLLGIMVPPSAELAARRLTRVNQARAALATLAARSASLRQLRSYEPRLTAANAPVEKAVTLIRRQLGLPPPDTS